ncbi:hypothetical protein EKK58_12500 [Candidatus Dependentiae bacterium]|nr:MAG: hypothetical protein EKK58_12500 [Candidatus Dependentiae bacterium]
MYIFKVKELRLTWQAEDMLSHSKYKELEAFCQAVSKPESSYFASIIGDTEHLAKTTLLDEVKRTLTARGIKEEQFVGFECDLRYTEVVEDLFYPPSIINNYVNLGTGG